MIERIPNGSQRLAALVALVALWVALGFTNASAQGANDFVGSEKCESCHKDAYRTWRDTGHARLVRPTRDGLLKDPGEHWAKDAKGNPGPSKGNADGKAYAIDDVQLVIGSKWKQRYLVKNAATGNHQFLDRQWNVVHRQWEPYGQKSDWETQCITCHATGVRIAQYDPANPAAQKVTMVERGIGCEACHGPGAKHSDTEKRSDIFNPAKVSIEQSALVCGYCHVRKENNRFKSAQGLPREDQPHPEPGGTYRAGKDDWRKWYPDQMLIPGVLANQPVTNDYPGTDLNGAFLVDEKSRRNGIFEARKHHQQYQELIQSVHYTKNEAGCSDCHQAHAVKRKKPVAPRDTCGECHPRKLDVDKLMPGLAATAQNLFVRSHAFVKGQDRAGGPIAPPPAKIEYFYAK